MNFGMIMKNQNMVKKQNCVIWIRTVSLYTYVEDDLLDFWTRFDTSNYELDIPLPKEKNKKVIGLKKDRLGSKTITKFAGFRAKTYVYLIDDSSKDNKAKGTKKCVVFRKIKFENYKICSEATQYEIKINHLEKNKIDLDSLKRDHKNSWKIKNWY